MFHSEFMTAKDLMNNLYCERITYFEHVLRIPQHVTRKEYEGRMRHEEFDEKSKRLKILPGINRLPRIYNLLLEDTSSGFRTIIDCLLVNDKKNEAFVVQVKNSAKPPLIYDSQRFQLYAEAYLARRKTGYVIRMAYIKYLKDKSLASVPVGINTERLFLKRLERIKQIIRDEVIPEPTEDKKKCTDCCFNKLCRRL